MIYKICLLKIALIIIAAISLARFRSALLYNALCDECYCGDKSGVQSVLSLGANINAIDHFGWTPAMWAAALGRIEVVEFLANRGADFKKQTKRGDFGDIGARTPSIVRSDLSEPLDPFTTAEAYAGGATARQMALDAGALDIVRFIDNRENSNTIRH